MMPCVYIAYDKDGAVLYVGKTIRFDDRSRAHAAKSKWFCLCDHFKIIHCETEEDALALESEKIRELDPPFNYSQTLRGVGKTACGRLKYRIAREVFRHRVKEALDRGAGEMLPERYLSRVKVMVAETSLSNSSVKAFEGICCKRLGVPSVFETYKSLFAQ